MPEPLIQQNQIIPLLSPVPIYATVGSTAASVIGANINRRGIMFANPSASAVLYLAPAGAPISAGQGVPLYPGAVLPFMAQGNYQVNCGWQAVSSVNGSPLTILEFV